MFLKYLSNHTNDSKNNPALLTSMFLK